MKAKAEREALTVAPPSPRFGLWAGDRLRRVIEVSHGSGELHADRVLLAVFQAHRHSEAEAVIAVADSRVEQVLAELVGRYGHHQIAVAVDVYADGRVGLRR